MNRPTTSDRLHVLGEVTEEEFLAGYWQKKPLLIRGAFRDLRCPLTPDELAGLACENGINSRLVLEDCGDRNWCVEYGPFDESRLQQLPASGWSLLVSDVERILPEARWIQNQFRFLPDWRHDDVMISLAPDGGSVGPHLDAYDVFLLQLHGRRRWMISEDFDPATLDDTDLDILACFEADEEWILEPGDMLYLPPNIAHHGTAEGTCMTCSIGFRAPSARDMCGAFVDYTCDRRPDVRYGDADTARQSHHAEITPQSIARLRAIIEDTLESDDESFSHWFGEYISDSRSQFDGYDEDDNAPRVTDIATDMELIHNPSVRFLFYRKDDASALLFINGESFEISTALAEAITCKTLTTAASLLETSVDDEDVTVIDTLLQRHYLLLSDGPA